CVTGSAMAETLDQIGTAIPGLRLARIGLEHAGPEIDEIPGGRCRAPQVERELELVCPNLVAHRLKRAEIGKDSVRVRASDRRIGGIRHRRIEANAAFADPLMQRPPEVLFGPAADSGRNIRGYVWAEQCSERRLQRSAAGKRFAARRGVAADAITHHGEVAAALDLFERLIV